MADQADWEDKLVDGLQHLIMGFQSMEVEFKEAGDKECEDLCSRCLTSMRKFCDKMSSGELPDLPRISFLLAKFSGIAAGLRERLNQHQQ